MNRFTGVLAFVEAVEAGSFAAAAKRMALSRSAVGKSIVRLERRLGTRLFHRTTRTQALTEDGQVFYERCTRALAELDAAEAVFDSGRRAPIGRLRVSAPVLFGRYCVAPVLLDLARKFPQLHLEVAFTDRVVDLISENVDLAVRSGPLADRAGVVARRLGAVSVVVCASPAYLAARGTPQSVADLHRHDTLAYVRGGFTVPWPFRGHQGRREDVTVKSRIGFDDLDAIADAAVAGAGIAWLPTWLVGQRLRTGKLVEVLEGAQRIGWEVYAVWPQMQHLPSKVRVAIDELVARIPAIIAAAESNAGT